MTHPNQTGDLYVMLHPERFHTVLGMYGPGTFAGWLLATCSVVVSWALNPKDSGTDTITNDFFGVMLAPIFAAAHVLYQVVTGSAVDKSESSLITSWYVEDMQAAAAVEAPLTVCEDFFTIGLLLMALATVGNQMPRKRMWALLVVQTVCVAVQVILFLKYGGIPAEYITLSRIFLFECPPALVALMALYAVIWGLLLVDVVIAIRRSNPGTRRTVLRLLRRAVLGAAVTIMTCQLYLKYYCRRIYGNVGHIENIPVFARNGKDDDGTDWWDLADGLHNRFVPKSAARFMDFEQLAVFVGGLGFLLFSIKEAVGSGRKGHSLSCAEEEMVGSVV
jgi:hypothetical protein